jgi:hypothetical protein
MQIGVAPEGTLAVGSTSEASGCAVLAQLVARHLRVGARAVARYPAQN